MIFLNPTYWQIKSTKNKGNGVFAKKKILKGTVIGDYIGTVLKTKDIDFKKDGDSLYLMYYNDQASIYPDLKKTGIHLINHSCSPNCWIYVLSGHTLFFALRDIKKGEELTIDYLLAPKTDLEISCSHVCKCGNDTCRKSFHLSKGQFEKWQNFQNKHAKSSKKERITYGKTLKTLNYYPKKIPGGYIKTLLLDLGLEE